MMMIIIFNMLQLQHQIINKLKIIISNLKLFMDQYDWKEIDFPPKQKKYCKKLESNNKSIALNVLYISYNTEKIRLVYKSKHNFQHKNQAILLMITDGKKWHYLAVKCLLALLRGITSNHNGDFYCLSCFH